MAFRFLRYFLLLLIAIGGYIAIRQGQVYRSLYAEKMRLVSKVGIMSIEDPSKVHVLRVKTDDRFKLAWRVYLPAEYTETWCYRTSSGGGSQSNSYPIVARERIVSVNFRVAGQNAVDIFILNDELLEQTQIAVPSGLSISPQEMIDLVIKSVSSAAERQVIDRHEVALLVESHWPPELIASSKLENPVYAQSLLDTPFFEFGFGTSESWERWDKELQDTASHE